MMQDMKKKERTLFIISFVAFLYKQINSNKLVCNILSLNTVTWIQTFLFIILTILTLEADHFGNNQLSFIKIYA
jgi:multisubunit Na+/H+ antiporter MnhF subunit